MKINSAVTERTRNKLVNSFWELYKNEDFTKITIGNICKNANYERTTFYRYFLDINEILNYLETNVIEHIRTDIQANSKQKKKRKQFLNKFQDFVNLYGEYIVVFYEKGNKNFYSKFKELVKNDVYTYFNFNVNSEEQKEFIFEFMFSSLINSYCYWYHHQDIVSLDAFVNFANNILQYGTHSILDYKNKEPITK